MAGLQKGTKLADEVKSARPEVSEETGNTTTGGEETPKEDSSAYGGYVMNV